MHPQPIHVHVKDLIIHVFGGFLGTQQRFTAVGGHRFVGFDATESGILIAQVAEASDQQPFMCSLPVPDRQAGGNPIGGESAEPT